MRERRSAPKLPTTNPKEGPQGRTITIRCTGEATLAALFRNVSKDLPELAPLLENATEQDDLEIFVNQSRLVSESAAKACVQAGDQIDLVLK